MTARGIMFVCGCVLIGIACAVAVVWLAVVQNG